MSKSLILHFQQASIDHSKKVAELLSMALLIARKLKKDDVCKLLTPEHEGYSDNDALAPYRLLFGDIVFPYNGREVRVDAGELLEEHMTKVTISISEIESLCERSDSEFFYTDIKSDRIEKLCREDLKKQIGLDHFIDLDPFLSNLINNNVGKIDLKLKVNKLSYIRIVNTVRSIIQRWAITLDESELTGDYDLFAAEKKIMAMNNCTINNVNSISGDVINSTVSQHNTASFKGDDDFLRQSLKEHFVSPDDIDEISEILTNSEPPKNKDSLPAKVNEWITKMVGKSLNGTWKVGIASAGGVLSQIICRYFGFN